MKKFVFSCVAVCAFSSVALASAEGGNGGSVANGQAFYSEHCVICHGAEGKGNGPGQLHEGLSKAEQLLAVFVGDGCDEAPSFDTAFAFNWVKAN